LPARLCLQRLGAEVFKGFTELLKGPFLSGLALEERQRRQNCRCVPYVFFAAALERFVERVEASLDLARVELGRGFAREFFGRYGSGYN